MKALLLVTCLLLTTATGCTTYYKMTDNASGQQYITNNWNWKMNRYTGSSNIKDLKSGKNIILQTFEYEVISEFDARIEIGNQ